MKKEKKTLKIFIHFSYKYKNITSMGCKTKKAIEMGN